MRSIFVRRIRRLVLNNGARIKRGQSEKAYIQPGGASDRRWKVHDIETGSINVRNLPEDSVGPSYIRAATANSSGLGCPRRRACFLRFFFGDRLENKGGVVRFQCSAVESVTDLLMECIHMFSSSSRWRSRVYGIGSNFVPRRDSSSSDIRRSLKADSLFSSSLERLRCFVSPVLV